MSCMWAKSEAPTARGSSLMPHSPSPTSLPHFLSIPELPPLLAPHWGKCSTKTSPGLPNFIRFHKNFRDLAEVSPDLPGMPQTLCETEGFFGLTVFSGTGQKLAVRSPTIMATAPLHRPSFCPDAEWAPAPAKTSKMCLFLVGSETVLHVALDNYLSTFLFRAAYYSKALASSYVWMSDISNICLQESQEFPLSLPSYHKLILFSSWVWEFPPFCSQVQLPPLWAQPLT